MPKGRVTKQPQWLTQFSSSNREVSLQYDPLLDPLGVGRCSGVDALQALLNGRVDSWLLIGYDLWHFGRFDAALLAEGQSLGAQLVCGLAVVVHDTLRKQREGSSLCWFYLFSSCVSAGMEVPLLWEWAAWRGTWACLPAAWRCWWWAPRPSVRPRWAQEGCSLHRRWWSALCKKVRNLVTFVVFDRTFQKLFGWHLTLDPSCDVQEVMLVVFSQISRVQPAILVKSLCCFIGHVQVTHEDVSTPETYLSIPVLIRVVQFRLAAWHHLPTAGKTSHKSLQHQTLQLLLYFNI